MIVIGKNRFDVPVPRGMRSFGLQQRIFPVAGRLASVLVAFLGLKDKAQLLDAEALEGLETALPVAMPKIAEVFAAMPPNELEAITRELLLDATMDGAPLFNGPHGDAFDAIMAGRTVDTWILLWHAVQTWYPDFFARGRGLLGQIKVPASQSKESTTSSTAGAPTA